MDVQTKRFVVLGVILVLVLALTSACGRGAGEEADKATRIVSTVNGDVEIPDPFVYV